MSETKISFDKKIENSFGEKLIKQEALTANVTLLSFSNQKVILKRVSARTKSIYDFLAGEKVDVALFPMKQFTDGKAIYFAYKYLNIYEYPKQKKIEDIFELMQELHDKTQFVVKLTEINFKYFYRTYRNLDRIFLNMEMLVRESEIKVPKEDFDWVILSKYSIFLETKKIMYQLQRKIHKYIDNKGSAIYCLNHGNLSLSHMVQKKLLSFDNGYLGIFVSDYAKLYVSVDHLSGEWFKFFDEALTKYENNFYKIYFKFLVLYIYMINIQFDSFHSTATMNTYIQISERINRFLSLTSSYQ